MGRKMVLAVAAIVVIVAIAFLLGPRVAKDTTVSFDASAIGDDPDAWLAAEEARYDDIREGLQKEIVWAFPESRARTPLALIYVHGFSASRAEAAPLTEMIADELGANVFYARLAGHGRDGEAMADGSVNAWVNDVAEALAIGRQIGERVVIISMSTGASLATWALTQPELAEDVAGIVLMSPNFKTKAGGSSMLTMPWGKQLANLVIGSTRSWEPRNDAHRHGWTYAYPTEAVLPMAATVEIANEAKVEDIGVPAFFIFSDADTVIDHTVTRTIMSRWGAETKVTMLPERADSDNHVLVGDALAPQNTGPVAAEITEWVRTLP